MRRNDALREGSRPRTLAAAQAFIRTTFHPVPPRIFADAAAALGLVLASPVRAPAPLPREAVAAMDGYAVRAADLAPGTETLLRLAGASAAGRPAARPLGPGEAFRISTGAVLPEGADRVARLETCRAGGGSVAVRGDSGRDHVRRRGEHVRVGDEVIAAGVRLGRRHLGLLHALGVERVEAWRPLRVAILSSGDELRDRGEPLGPGQATDANRPYLRATLAALGCEVEDRGILPDDPAAMLTGLVEAAAGADLIVTSGGASIGPADLMSRLIPRRGCLEFWRLAMRPGRPVGFGDIDDCPILALPGNPVAAAAAFAFLARPLIGRLSGDGALLAPDAILPLATPADKPVDRADLRLARRVRAPEGGDAAELLPWTGAADLRALAEAEVFAHLPAGLDSLAAGAPVELVAI